MPVFDIHEAETRFLELIEMVINGEEVVITKAGRAVARILPITDKSPRKPGIDKGGIVIMPDFDDPLPEFDE